MKPLPYAPALGRRRSRLPLVIAWMIAGVALMWAAAFLWGQWADAVAMAAVTHEGAFVEFWHVLGRDFTFADRPTR